MLYMVMKSFASKKPRSIRIIFIWIAFALVQFWVIYHWYRHAKPIADGIFTQQKQQTQRITYSRKQRQPSLQLEIVYHNIDESILARLAHPFPRWENPFPCFPCEDNWNSISQLRQPTDRGFFYFKARKAGSSTVAGIALRIATHMAQRLKVETPHCHTRYGHPAAHILKYYQRDKAHSFLWSVIREPTKRHVSEFFHFAVSRWKLEPTYNNFQWYFSSTEVIHNYYLQFMSTQHEFKNDGATNNNYMQAVATIMNEYNFIGISERMHESLVCLQMMLNLTTSDILYISAKQNGGFDDGLYKGTCHYIVPTYISPAMKEYIESQAWRKYTQGDNLLYTVVNRSLDLTIDSLGRRDFNQKLQVYRNALQVAQIRCGNVTFPCSPGGTMNDQHDCYLWDSGCGYSCLDQVANELGVD